MAKTLVLYVFHENNWRVKWFIDNAIFYDPNVHFIIISNNQNVHLDLPSFVTYAERKNVGYDFGGWSDALFAENTYKSYDYFIFVNSSVVGPFIRPDCKEKWTDIYINGLRDNVKLFGATINTYLEPLSLSHVQSYIFSMDKHTLEYLIDCRIFSSQQYAQVMLETIFHKEVAMSRKILEKGWNIGSLLPHYNNIDFTFSTKTPDECGIKFLGDIMFNEHKGTLWNEYDLVFVKGNRNIDIPYVNAFKLNNSIKVNTPETPKNQFRFHYT